MQDLINELSLNPLNQVKSFGPKKQLVEAKKISSSLNPLNQVKSFGRGNPL